MSESDINFPLHLFHHGTNFKAYETMGAHPFTRGRKRGYVFRVWAPHAKKVSVVGDFNQWDKDSHVMERLIDNETFELFISGVKQYDCYKYCIETADGKQLFKADPYAFHAENPGPGSSNASKLYDLSGFNWTDRAYSDKLKHKNVYASPLNIYEVNLLSWKLHENGSPSLSATSKKWDIRMWNLCPLPNIRLTARGGIR